MAILHVNILVDGCKFTVPEWCVLIDIDFIVIVPDEIFAMRTYSIISQIGYKVNMLSLSTEVKATKNSQIGGRLMWSRKSDLN